MQSMSRGYNIMLVVLQFLFYFVGLILGIVDFSKVVVGVCNSIII